MNHPALVLADEPTGALDSKTSHEIMNLLTQLNQQGTTVVLVTHDATVADQTKRVIRMQDGVIVENSERTPNRELLTEYPKDVRRGIKTKTQFI